MSLKLNPVTGQLDLTVIGGTGGVGNVVGPASSTDNAVARFDGITGKIIQNSNATLDDSGELILANGLTITTGDISVNNGSISATGSFTSTAGNIETSNGNIAAVGNILGSGYARFGSLNAPANTTAGDITGVRLNIGNVIHSAANGQVVHMSGTLTDTSSTSAFLRALATISPASASTATFRGISFLQDTTGTGINTLNTLQAGVFINKIGSTGAITAITGLQGLAVFTDTSNAVTITTAIALDARLYQRSAGSATVNITTGIGLDLSNLVAGTGAVFTTFKNINITDPPASTATITTHYGIDIGKLTRTATGGSIYGIRLAQPGILNGVVATTDSIALNLPSDSIALGNQTATTTNAHGISIGQATYTSTTNTRTLTNAASLYIAGAPVASTNVTVTNGPYALWVDAGVTRLDGAVMMPITTVTTTTTLDTTHYTVLADATSGNITINLPTAASASGRVYVIKKTDSSANTVTIDGSGAETIDGATTNVISTQYVSITIQSNGTFWSIL